ncbi:MAG: YHYH protein [Acidobacteriota bacterium]
MAPMKDPRRVTGFFARSLPVWWILFALAVSSLAWPALAQLMLRRHTAASSNGLELLPASMLPKTANQVSESSGARWRTIRANGVPDHAVGTFPNAGNPNRLSAQSYRFRVPMEPRLAADVTPLSGPTSFGVAVNGVPFDPGAAEFFLGDRSSGWQYEALAGAVPLGIDANHAHVQPTGAYHYHGLPTGLLDELDFVPGRHSPLVGWAADGFPIYALYGRLDGESGVRELLPSYRLRQGQRPAGEGQPGGVFDGTFVADYEYVDGAGDLDECNGLWTVTPEFPDGTYAYFLTADWPVVPRCFRGTPSPDFRKARGLGHQGRRTGRG